MESLPREILFNIISWLDPVELLNCIHVSRSWRAIVPEAVNGVWHNLEINEYDEMIMRCLDGVKFFPSLVHFRLSSIWLLRMLSPGQVRKLETSVYDHKEAMRLLLPHAPYLESLSIAYDGLDTFYYPNILNACSPALSTFRLCIQDVIEDLRPYYMPGGSMMPPIKPQVLGLTFLELAMNLPKNDMRALLTRCPRLVILKLINQDPYHRLGLHEILGLCPRLARMAYVSGCGNSLALLSTHIPLEFDWAPSDIDHLHDSSASRDCNHNDDGSNSSASPHPLGWLYADKECALYDPAIPDLCSTLHGLHVATTKVSYRLGSDNLRVFSCGSAHTPRKLAEVLQNSPRLSVLRIDCIVHPLTLIDPDVLRAAATASSGTGFDHPQGVRTISVPIYQNRLDHAIRFLEPFKDALEHLNLCCSRINPRGASGSHGQVTLSMLRPSSLMTPRPPPAAVSPCYDERTGWEHQKDLETADYLLLHLPRFFDSLPRLDAIRLFCFKPLLSNLFVKSLGKFRKVHFDRCQFVDFNSILDLIESVSRLRELTLTQCREVSRKKTFVGMHQGLARLQDPSAFFIQTLAKQCRERHIHLTIIS